jgi:tetratricopeptide (TPR) repeat protein
MTKSNDRNDMGILLTFDINDELYYRKGLREYKNNNFQQAIKYIKKAVELDPTNDDYQLELANLYSEVGNYVKSNEILKDIYNKNKNIIECVYLIATNYAYLGLFYEAQKYARKYIEISDDGEFVDDALDLLEMIEIEDEDLEEGLLKEESLIFKQELAKELLEKGQLQKAVQLLQEIISEHPKYWPAYNNLALAYLHLGRTETAIEKLNYILANNDGNIHALCNLVVVYFHTGEREKMEELLSKLEVIEPIYVEHRVKLGATFGMVGRYERAYRWLRSAKKHGIQETTTFLYWLAVCSYELGKYEIAENAWERLSKKQPEHSSNKPWVFKHRYSKTMNQEFPIEMYVEDFIAQDFTVEEQLLALYLLIRNVLNEEKSKISLMELICKSKEISPFVKVFIEQLVSKKDYHESEYRLTVERSITIADILFNTVKSEHNEKIEWLLLIWFKTFIIFFKSTLIESDNGWAGAFYYLVFKKQETKVTQKQVCELFKISVTTLRRYVKLLEDLTSKVYM